MYKKGIIFGILFIMTFIIMSFELPKNILKKVSKEIQRTYEVENFELKPVSISDKYNNQLLSIIDSTRLYTIINNQKKIGYAYIAKAPSKTDEYDYAVFFDNDFVIKKAKVLIYREDYGAEIGSKRWLKQFIGKTIGNNLKYEKDIITISGATISARSMTIAINNLLSSIAQLQKLKVL